MLPSERLSAQGRKARRKANTRQTRFKQLCVIGASVFLFLLIYLRFRDNSSKSVPLASGSPAAFYSNLLQKSLYVPSTSGSPASFYTHLLDEGEKISSQKSTPIEEFRIASDETDLAAAAATYEEAVPGTPLNIRILETWGCHDEVTAAFLYSFKDTSHRIQLFLRNQRFGIGQLYNAFFKESSIQPEYPKLEEFNLIDIDKKPDVIISVSCRWDLQHFYDKVGMDRMFDETDSMLYCLVHLCDEWDDVEQVVKDRMKKWADAKRLRWITLSPHVSKCVSWQVLPVVGIWGLSSPSAIIRTFPPIFEPTLEASERIDIYANNAAATYFLQNENEKAELVIQGNVENFRRNYQQIFDDLKEQIRRHSSSVRLSRLFSKITITILGQVSPYHEDARSDLNTVSIQSRITYKHGLSYVDYYQSLSNGSLLLPAFADNTYRLSRASSSMAASIISGIPLIADLDLLTRYSYIPPEAVWLLGPEETEVDGALRVLGKSAYERAEKKLQLAFLRDALIKENAENMQSWLQQDTI